MRLRLPRFLRRRVEDPVPAVLLTRADCPLCDELGQLLAKTGLDRSLCLERVDVDSSRELKKSYGLRIPVLLVGGEVCAEGRVEPKLVERRVRERTRAWRARKKDA